MKNYPRPVIYRNNLDKKAGFLSITRQEYDPHMVLYLNDSMAYLTASCHSKNNRFSRTVEN